MATSKETTPTKRTTARSRAAAKKLLEEAAKAPETPPQDQPFNAPAVLVWRDQQPNGDESVQVSVLNGLDPLAVPSMLKFGLKVQNEILGID